MSKERCQEIIRFHKTHRHLTGVGDGSDYTGIRFMHIKSPWLRNYVAETVVNLIGEIRKTSDQIVYPEMIAINEWPIGGVQSPHLDTYSNQEMNHGTSPDKPSREWTCILYLNDNYKAELMCQTPKSMNQKSSSLFQVFTYGVEKARRHTTHISYCPQQT